MPTRRGQPAAVRTVSHTVNIVGMSGSGESHRFFVHIAAIPEHDPLFGVAGRQTPAVGRSKSHCPRTEAASRRESRKRLLGAGGIPEDYRPIRAGAGHGLSVGAECDAKSGSVVAFGQSELILELEPVLALAQVPATNLIRGSDAARDEMLSVATERQTAGSCLGAL